MKWRWLYFTISLSIIVPGLFFLARYGLRPAIDFTGGTLLEIQSTSVVPESDQLRVAIEPIMEVSTIQTTQQNTFVIRGKTTTDEQKNQILAALGRSFPDSSFRELRYETVGPILGQELLIKTSVGIVLAAVFIMLYVARQFNELRYGISAIISMLHDSLVLLSIFSILGVVAQVEVDVLFVTALLTTLSFSVHDTIVVYDRIREIKQKHSGLSLTEVINAAVLQTLSRSLNNSLTIIFMLLCLVVLGGSTVQWFAVALLVGAITGTYSSTFTAAPLILVWDDIASWWRSRQLRK